jgi:uncharacterized repeat protein (TIGR03803 family)
MNKMKNIFTIIFLILFIQNVVAQSNTVIKSFSSNPDGNKPYCSLYYDGTFLYGTTMQGGANNKGAIFKVKPDGTGDTLLFNFNGIYGASPSGSLISDGTFLFGMTQSGGANNYGTVFKIKPDGSGDTVIVNFTGMGGNAQGHNPDGDLFYDGTFLYGMTNVGGANNKGVIFKVKTDGTGYLNLLDFAGVPDGQMPNGSLYYDGTFFYGMTNGGGVNSVGTMFKIRGDGTGYLKLLDFSSTICGAGPLGSFISDGTYLYGMTNYGGLNNNGTIFRIKTDGTGDTLLHSFNGTNGAGPYFGSLLYNGLFLYGMTNSGGTSGHGTIFKIKPDGSGFATLFNFSGLLTGMYPYGSLITDGTSLYGTTYFGGANDLGTVFKFGSITDVNEISEDETLRIYPTPADNILSVESSIQATEIKITDILGGEVFRTYSLVQQLLQINVSSLQNGIYFVNIKTNQGLVTKKIVVQH